LRLQLLPLEHQLNNLRSFVLRSFLYCIGRHRRAEVSKVEVSKVTGSDPFSHLIALLDWLSRWNAIFPATFVRPLDSPFK
jgi:hypothetical protein